MAIDSFLSRVGAWFGDIPEWMFTLIIRWSTLIGGGVTSMGVYLWDRLHDSSHPFSLSSLYWIMGGALIASGYDAWHVERRAVRGLRKSNFPAIKGDVSYFEAMDWQRISGQDKQLLDLAYRLELKAGEALVRFEARIDLVNSGAESRALDWRFSAKKKDGGIVEFAPTPVQWSHPHWWPNVEYLSFNEFEGEYLKPGKTYRIFVCLTTKNVNPKDDYESLNQSFRAILKDETGAEVVCE